MTDKKMIDEFDSLIKKRYSYKDLNNVCKANFSLVPQSIIISMKSAFGFDFTKISVACNYLLGWNNELFSYYETSKKKKPINLLFQEMQKTFLTSCSTICLDPDNHFEEYSDSNRCFPIGKVFEVISKLSNNIANKLLDISLVQEIHKQIKLKEKKEILKEYRIKRSNSIRNKIFKILRFKSDFEVLLIDFQALNSVDDCNKHGNSSLRDYSDYINNLKQNLDLNFMCKMLHRPSECDHFKWDESLMQCQIIVLVLTVDIIELISSTWNKFIGTKRVEHCDSLTDSVNFGAYEDSQIDSSRKFQYNVWTKIKVSNKVKIGITFQFDSLPKIMEIFPISFLLPNEIQTFLNLINETIK